MLLFGEETCILIPSMERALSSFQHRFAQRLIGRHVRIGGGVWELVIPLIGGGNGGSRLQGDWDIRHKEAEYGRAVYCDATDSGHL